MELETLYKLIGLQPEIAGKLEEIRKEEIRKDEIRKKEIRKNENSAQIDTYLEQLMDIRTADSACRSLEACFPEDTDHLKMLYCQLECARRIADKYQEKQIPEAIFTDTMKCFPRFIDECNRKNGRMFFDRHWWTYRQISMSLFRIGTLEYEFCNYEGEKVIAIHIPSDADLSGEAVEDSLKQAEAFFQTYYREYAYEKYICDSWLLSPALSSLLPETSNIFAFQKRFTIVCVNQETKEYMEWLFQVPEDTEYQELPERTGLQRRAKKLLLNGGALGSAVGVMKKASLHCFQ